MANITCSNCGEDLGSACMFCEACGFQAATGSVVGHRGGVMTTLGPPSIAVSVGVDRNYFTAVVTEGAIDLPDQVVRDIAIELPGTEIHIGRTSESRAIHPDLDIAATTGDPAVSSRHAVLSQDAGKVAPVEPGTPIYLGAWTRIVVVDNSQFVPGQQARAAKHYPTGSSLWS